MQISKIDTKLLLELLLLSELNLTIWRPNSEIRIYKSVTYKLIKTLYETNLIRETLKSKN